MFRLINEVFLVWECELGDKVCQSLCLDCSPRVVLDVELVKLDCPLDHSPCYVRFVHGPFDGLVCHYQDGVCLEVGT